MVASILILVVGAFILIAIPVAVLYLGLVKWGSRSREKFDEALVDRLAQVLSSKGFTRPQKFQFQLGLGTRIATFTSIDLLVDLVIDEPKGEICLEQRRANAAPRAGSVLVSVQISDRSTYTSYAEAADRLIAAAESVDARSLTRA